MTKKILLPLLMLPFFAGMFVFAPMVSTSLVSTAAAQGTTSSPCTGGADCPQAGLNAIGAAFPQSGNQNLNPQQLLKKIIDWALYISAIAAVIMIIVGGYLYIFSAGNDAQAKKGRDTMQNALIGLALIILSYIIVQVVYNFLSGR